DRMCPAMKRSLSILAGAALLVGLMATPVSAASTTGTWTQSPTGATVYTAGVQPPINVDGSSNWPAKSKGGIPLMFKLSSGTGSAVFQSLQTAQAYSFLSFAPSPSLTFGQL